MQAPLSAAPAVHGFQLCLGQVVEWFCGGLDYEYTPAIHGSQPEWLADLISTSFDKPLKTFKRSMQTRKVSAPPPGTVSWTPPDASRRL